MVAETQKTTDRCDGLHAAIRNRPEVLGACTLYLVEGLFLPEQIGDRSQVNIICGARSRTVSSLIKVDFPAPLGPIMPTRLKEEKKLVPVESNGGGNESLP